MEEDLIIGDTGLPVARELAEMELIKHDLSVSLASLTIWVERYSPKEEENEKDRAINGSLFRDGITQFVGCFDSKNAYPLIVEEVYPNVAGIGPISDGSAICETHIRHIGMARVVSAQSERSFTLALDNLLGTPSYSQSTPVQAKRDTLPSCPSSR